VEQLPDPQWAADPYRRHELRYWDGGQWTEHVSDHDVQTVDDPWTFSVRRSSDRSPSPFTVGSASATSTDGSVPAATSSTARPGSADDRTTRSRRRRAGSGSASAEHPGTGDPSNGHPGAGHPGAGHPGAGQPVAGHARAGHAGGQRPVAHHSSAGLHPGAGQVVDLRFVGEALADAAPTDAAAAGPLPVRDSRYDDLRKDLLLRDDLRRDDLAAQDLSPAGFVPLEMHPVDVPAQRPRPGAKRAAGALRSPRRDDSRRTVAHGDVARRADLPLDDPGPVGRHDVRPSDVRPGDDDPLWLGLGLFGTTSDAGGTSAEDAVRAGASAVGWTPAVGPRSRGSRVPATVAGVTVGGLLLGVVAFGALRGPSADDTGAFATVVPVVAPTTPPTAAPSAGATTTRPSSTLPTATAAKISTVSAPPIPPVARTTSSAKPSTSRTAPSATSTTTAPPEPDPTTTSQDASSVTRYKNCAALNADFPHGVARSDGKDVTSGGADPVTTFAVNEAVYAANTRRDFDGDGVACERA